MKKTLFVGFFAYLIGNWNKLARIVFESFAGLGLKAGGLRLSTADFLRPGRVAQVGLDAGRPLLDAASQMMGYVVLLRELRPDRRADDRLAAGLLAFFILAIQLFVTLIEFKLTTLAGFVLIPFGLFGKTAFLAESVLGNVVSSGVKVLVLAVIVGIGSTLFSQFTHELWRRAADHRRRHGVVLAALSLLGLGIFGPGIANGLVSGGSAARRRRGRRDRRRRRGRRNGRQARRSASPEGGATAAASGAAATARGGARLAGGAASAYALGSAGESGPSAVAAGLAGVGRAAGAVAAAPFRRAAARATSSLAENYSAGARAAFAATGGASTTGAVGHGATGAPAECAARLGAAHEAQSARQPRRVDRRPCHSVRRQPWRRRIPSISPRGLDHVQTTPPSATGARPNPKRPIRKPRRSGTSASARPACRRRTGG